MAADVAEVVPYTGDGGGTIVITKPAAFAATQILVAVLVDTGTNLANLTAPSPAWVEQENPYSASNSKGKVFTHPFDVADPASWNFGYNAGETAAALVFRITGADITPVVVVTSAAIPSNGASEAAPSVDPDGDTDLLISLLAISGSNNPFSSTDPVGMTDLGQVQVLNLFMGLAAAKEALASGAPTGTRTWTGISPTGRQGGLFSVAVKSAAGAVQSMDVTIGITMAVTPHLVVSQAPSPTLGGWESFMAVAAEAAAIQEEERTAIPVACPNDGEPLVAGPGGVLYCPYDGWQYPRDWVRPA